MEERPMQPGPLVDYLDTVEKNKVDFHIGKASWGIIQTQHVVLGIGCR